MRALPLIGLTTSGTVGASPERAYTNAAYIDAIQHAGGVPVLLPPSLSGPARTALWDRLDGLILSGGGDVDPARFGEERHPATYDVSAARDELELDLAGRALREGLPLLAICRGIQVLNVALGGTLHQDIATDPGSPLAHSQSEPRDQATHAVKILAGSRLAAALGRLELDVNSLHHQAIKDLGRGLRAVGTAPDGIVEGAEIPGHPFAVAVQWHPEELVGHDGAARQLFRAVVEAAALRARPSLS
jgi:putative glutamine amidotransferase